MYIRSGCIVKLSVILRWYSLASLMLRVRQKDTNAPFLWRNIERTVIAGDTPNLWKGYELWKSIYFVSLARVRERWAKMTSSSLYGNLPVGKWPCRKAQQTGLLHWRNVCIATLSVLFPATIYLTNYWQSISIIMLKDIQESIYINH